MEEGLFPKMELWKQHSLGYFKLVSVSSNTCMESGKAALARTEDCKLIDFMVLL